MAAQAAGDDEPGGHVSPSRAKSPGLITEQLLESGVAVWDDALNAVTAAALYLEMLALYERGCFATATVGRARRARADVRSDEILWMLPKGEGDEDHFVHNPALIALRLVLDGIREALSPVALVRLDEVEMMATRYPAGGYYAPHVDTFADHGDRLFTFVYFLNPAWVTGDGGLLQLRAPAPSFEPRMGRLVIFHTPGVVHEVTVTRAARFAVTGWFKPRRRD